MEPVLGLTVILFEATTWKEDQEVFGRERLAVRWKKWKIILTFKNSSHLL